jgi:hypothetical protein
MSRAARGVYRPEGWPSGPKHTTTHTVMHTAAHAALASRGTFGMRYTLNGFKLGNILSFDERQTPNDKRGKNRK